MIQESDRIECRKRQLRLLDTLKAICDKHGLIYWIDFGTLLGAVRQKGYIPWDDDIDVSMPMKDYRKFLEIAESELPRDIFLQTPKTDRAYRSCFAKLRDCYSTFIEHHESEKNTYHKGIYMDIFPSIYYPKMPRIVKKVLLYFTVKSRDLAAVRRQHVIWNYTIYGICKFIWLLFAPFKSSNVGRTYEDNGYYESIPTSVLYPLSSIEFESKMYAAPGKPHEYLALMYGSTYMTPPPVEKRIPHAKIILPNTPCDHPRAITRNA